MANEQREIESAEARGVSPPGTQQRALTRAVIGLGTFAAADALTRALGAKFGARSASYAARADAHERRARSRSARSARLHTERAAELRRRSTTSRKLAFGACAETLHGVLVPRDVPNFLMDEEEVADYELSSESGDH
jgi:hypothetical protein